MYLNGQQTTRPSITIYNMGKKGELRIYFYGDFYGLLIQMYTY
jgi:hypothetical protein